MGLAKKDHVRELLQIDHVQKQWEKKYNRLPDEMDVEEIYTMLTPGLKKIVGNYSNAIPGVADLFTYIKARGIKIGSTTGYVSEMMEDIIPAAESQNILPDSVVTSDDTPAGRPKPFMIYQNAMNLEVFPLSHMVKVGDTVADIKEGLNAGMWTVGYTKCGNEVGLTEEEVNQLPELEVQQKIETAEKKLKEAGAHFVVEGPWQLIPILEKINEMLAEGHTPDKSEALKAVL
jgi:phosphonoacetaldehyde hydrolase